MVNQTLQYNLSEFSYICTMQEHDFKYSVTTLVIIPGHQNQWNTHSVVVDEADAISMIQREHRTNTL